MYLLSMIKLQYKKKGRQSCTQNEHTIVGRYDKKLCRAQICARSCGHFGVRCAASFAGGCVGVGGAGVGTVVGAAVCHVAVCAAICRAGVFVTLVFVVHCAGIHCHAGVAFVVRRAGAAFVVLLSVVARVWGLSCWHSSWVVMVFVVWVWHSSCRCAGAAFIVRVWC